MTNKQTLVFFLVPCPHTIASLRDNNVHSTKHKNKDAYTLLQPQVKELKKIQDADQHCNDITEWQTKIQNLIHVFSNP